MSERVKEFTVRAVGRGVEVGSPQPSVPGPEHKRLEAFIGRWINEGQTVGTDPAMTIITSDVYEWMPGGFFVLHTAYGKTGTFTGGGTEIMGWDAEAGHFRSWFFDSTGNLTQHKLTYHDGTWIWQGETTRCKAAFDDDGCIQSANHERTDDGENWVPSMQVTLTRVD